MFNIDQQFSLAGSLKQCGGWSFLLRSSCVVYSKTCIFLCIFCRNLANLDLTGIYILFHIRIVLYMFIFENCQFHKFNSSLG